MKKDNPEKLPIWKKEDYDLINTGTKQIVLSFPVGLDNILNTFKRIPGTISLIERILQSFEEEARTLLKEVAPMVDKHQEKKPSDNDTLVKVTKWQMEGSRFLAKCDSANRVLKMAKAVREAISARDPERAAIDMMRLVFGAVTANLYETVIEGIRARGARKRGGTVSKAREGIILAIETILPKVKRQDPLSLWQYLKKHYEGQSKGLWVGDHFGLPRYQVYFYPESSKPEKSLLFQYDDITGKETSIVFPSFVRLVNETKKRLQ